MENCCSSFELVQKVKYYSIFLKFGKFLLLLFFLFSHHCLCIMMLDFRFHFLTFNKKLCNVFSLSNVCNRIFVREHVQHVVDIDYTTLVNSYCTCMNQNVIAMGNSKLGMLLNVCRNISVHLAIIMKYCRFFKEFA